VLTDFRRGWLAENTWGSIRRTVDVSRWSLLDLFWGGRFSGNEGASGSVEDSVVGVWFS